MKYIVCVIAFFFSQTLSGQTQLQRAVDQFAGQQLFEHAHVGVCVIDVETGQELAAFQSNKSLIPASSLKVLTTSAALKILGPEFRFQTELQYNGTISSDGTLNGNIFIKGFGDPTLGSNDLQEAAEIEEVLNNWVTAIQEAGIKTIDGYIIGDASFYETGVNVPTWLWEDLGNYYATGAWGLNIHDNRYYLSLQQKSRLGAKPVITGMDPQIPGLQLINEIRSAEKGTGDQAYIFGSPFNYTRFIRGTIPIGTGEMTIKGSIPDPPAFAAQLLMQNLEKKGVRVKRAAVSLLELEQAGASSHSKIDQPRKVLLKSLSPPLAKIIREANQKSINLYCESILKMLGWQQRKEASTEAGVTTLLEFWSQNGISVNGLYLEDGSGLSVRNGITAQQLTTIMATVAKDKQWYDQFEPTLPLAGKSGTLRGLFKGSSVSGKLRAKSGGMSRVRSYTGFVLGPGGRLRAFSLIANNFSAESRDVRNQMVKLMIKMGQLK